MIHTQNSIKSDTNKIFVGTSGYSYTDWKNVFYPTRLASQSFLDYYSLFFSAVELNFSFYQWPTAHMFSRFLQSQTKIPKLSIKAFQGITHKQNSEIAMSAFLKAVKPLADSDRVSTVLFQFPYSFRPGKEAWNLLEQIALQHWGAVGVIEFRHISWFQEKNLQRIAEMNLAVCALDMPNIQGLPGGQMPVTHPIGYMRFHGRNAEKWWNHNEAWERYNYFYSSKILNALLPDLRSWIDKHQKVFLFFNNHYRGQAVQNAQTLMAFLAD